MLGRILPLILLMLSLLPARAQPPEQLQALFAALRVPELTEVMRQEGLDYGGELEAEMFAGRGGARWQDLLGQIYAPGRMDAMMRAAVTQSLPPDADLAPVLRFYQSALGARLVAAETEARRTLLDPQAEELSAQAWQKMRAEEDPRLELIERFIGANDLIEMNVVGGLNSNLAFYRGLNRGDAFDYVLGEDEMLSDVWSQEQGLREDTESWIYPYLILAYQGLEDGDLEAYIAFSQSPSGQMLNQALFAGFDLVFQQVSDELGFAAAQMLSGQDI